MIEILNLILNLIKNVSQINKCDRLMSIHIY